MDNSKLPLRPIESQARTIHPGAWAIEPTRPLATLLGSCVAVCLFDPKAGIGGLNHFMLPNIRRSKHVDEDSLLAGSYAMEALLNALLQRGARKSQLQAKAFGGGTILNTSNRSMDIGLRNAEFAKEWLSREEIPLLASDFLGPWTRKVVFLPACGTAYCKRTVTNMASTAVLAREEQKYAASLARKHSSSDHMIELF